MSTRKKTRTKKLSIANEYGDVDVRDGLSKAYVHIPGKRLQPLCRKLGIKFAPALVGFKGNERRGFHPILKGVVVSKQSAEMLRAAIAERLDRQQQRKEREQRAKLQKERDAQEELQRLRQTRRQVLEAKCPALPNELLDRVSKGSFDYYEQSEQIPNDLYTTSEWRILGYRVVEDIPAAVFIAPKGRPHLLFLSRSVRPVARRISDRPASELWDILVDHYGDESLALVRSVWIANRLIKLDPLQQRKFYALKDSFLFSMQSYLVEGRIAREETLPCYRCEWASSRRRRSCDHCGGTGIYDTRTLFEHHLRVGSHDFCFHSYQSPASLSKTTGADLGSYGRRFTAQELRELPPLRLTDHIRVLEYRLDAVVDSMYASDYD